MILNRVCLALLCLLALDVSAQSIIEVLYVDEYKYSGDRNAKGQADGEGELYSAKDLIYKGHFSNGKVSGKGEYYRKPKYEADPAALTYRGSFADGLPQGYGEVRFEDGSYYLGNFDKGAFSGKGKRYNASAGETHEGQFRASKLHGKGKLTTDSGLVIEGVFDASVLQGKGRLKFPDGRVFSGNFVNNQISGYGVMNYPSGVSVEGEFDSNMEIVGDARVVLPNGDSYQGGMRHGEFDGKGLLESAEHGFSYKGDFMLGKFHGKGEYKAENGMSYVGEFRFGSMFGQGKLTYANGGSFEGYFADGIPDGVGTCNDAVECEFADGERIR